MKRMLLCVAATLLCVAGAEAKQKNFSEVRQVLTLEQLNVEMTKEICSGLHPDFAIEFSEGENLPLHFLMQSDIFSIKIDPQLAIRLEKACYLRVIKNKAYLSDDLVHWKRARHFFNTDYLATLKTDQGKAIFEEILPAD